MPSRRFVLAALMLLAAPVGAQPAPSLDLLRLSRSEDGLRLAYNARLELPRPLDDALHKGVPLYFVAEAQLTRSRWYWRDAVVAGAQRHWRISYQPLTRQYRLSTGGLHQSFDSLGEALAPLARASGWPMTLREELQADAEYQLEFALRLDISQLPAPLQIGLGPGASLNLRREQRVNSNELLSAPPAGTPAATPSATPTPPAPS